MVSSLRVEGGCIVQYLSDGVPSGRGGECGSVVSLGADARC